MEHTNKIRIIQITHDLNIGGLQRLVVDIARSLDRELYEVAVCALRGTGPLEQELLDEGIRVLQLPPARNGTDYLTFWKLYKLFRREQPHIVHTHNTQPFLEGGIAACMARVPAFVHTDHGRHFPDKKRYMIAEKVMSNFADAIVAVSEGTKNDLVRHERIRSDRIQVVINGVDGRKYQNPVDKAAKMKELNIGGRRGFVLGFAGRLSPEKGLHHLIAAMSVLVKEHPDMLLLIAGDGPLENALQTETSAKGLEGNIRFLGPRSDVAEILGVLDAIVLPSLREGLPLILLEAASSGLPIIATKVGGTGAVVQDGRNGYLVPAGDEPALCEAVRSLVHDPGKAKIFGEASRRIFAERFGLGRMMSHFCSFYRDCLAAG